MNRMSPEAEFLLLCVQPTDASHGSPQAAARNAQDLVDACLDFDALFELAGRHRLRSLLSRRIDDMEIHSIPHGAHTALWTWSVRVESHATGYADELARTLEAFESAAIPALPYKGPVLAQSLFGDVGLREFSDLDILVRADDAVRAAEILVANGYVASAPNLARLMRSSAEYHAEYVHATKGIGIELHWKTDSRFPVEEAFAQPWWKRHHREPFGESSVRAITASELLLVLCVHGSKHHWSSLAWLVDVAQLMCGRNAADFESLIEIARRFGCERRFALGLRLAQRLLNAPLPHAAQQWLASQGEAIEPLCSRLSQHLLAREAVEVSVFDRLRLDLHLCDRVRDRISHTAGVLLRPTGEDEHAAGGSVPIASALRIARLLRRYAA